MRLSAFSWFVLVSVSFPFSDISSVAKSIRSVQESSTLDLPAFFYRYGYLPSNTERSSPTDEELTFALRKYQYKMGLPVTGEFDPETENLIRTPRCPLPDFFPDTGNDTRGRYAYSGSRWATTNLRWIVNKADGSFSRSELENLVATAVMEWSRPSLLTFTKGFSLLSEIVVDFVIPDAQGNHGDGAPFASDDLGHAFYPPNGDLHVNMNQQFFTSAYNPFASDLLFVVVHELGHSLGLDHSSYSSAVMYPSLSRGRRYSGLHGDDVSGIQSVYGRNRFYSGGQSMEFHRSLLLIAVLSSFFNFS